MDGDNLMTGQCRECRATGPHCHGALIRHPGGFSHCTEPGCGDSEVLLHSFSVDCETLGCGCGESVAHRHAV